MENKNNQTTKTVTTSVTSFFFYMWNAWCKEECDATFGKGVLSDHFWSEWVGYGCKIDRFYAELDDVNRELLCERANLIFNGRGRTSSK